MDDAEVLLLQPDLHLHQDLAGDQDGQCRRRREDQEQAEQVDPHGQEDRVARDGEEARCTSAVGFGVSMPIRQEAPICAWATSSQTSAAISSAHPTQTTGERCSGLVGDGSAPARRRRHRPSRGS